MAAPGVVALSVVRRNAKQSLVGNIARSATILSQSCGRDSSWASVVMIMVHASKGPSLNTSYKNAGQCHFAHPLLPSRSSTSFLTPSYMCYVSCCKHAP